MPKAKSKTPISRGPFFTKGRLLALWVAFAGFAYISASQNWYTLSMSPNGDTVKLSSYDGLTSYGNLSAILMLNFAAILVVAFVGSWARRITTGLVSILSTITLVWIISKIVNQDISGLAKQVEQMTGIAAAHGIDGVSVSTENSAYLFTAVLALIIGAQLLVIFTERFWVKRSGKTDLPRKNSKPSEPKDAIGIWDSQRR